MLAHSKNYKDAHMKCILKLMPHILAAYFLFGLTCIVNAEGMDIKYGLWETKSIVAMPFGGATQERISQDCITEKITKPEQLMQNAPGCEVLEKEVGSDTMRWTVSCNNADIEMIGEGNLQSTETTLTGSMKITATVDDQEMVMNTSWEGRYIGECS